VEKPDLPSQEPRWFELKPKITLTVYILFLFVFLVLALEIVLRSFWGLGNPLLYESSYLYGYRPAPNQVVSRNRNIEIKINNLGLRADSDWNEIKDNKILFLGDSVTYGGSYITNDELFSALAVKSLDGWESGNGGVNAWGVGNVYKLIVHACFMPAKVYVSVFPEMDFYRGISRLPGLPFWSKKPSFAIEEALYHFYYRQNMKRYDGIHSNKNSDDEKLQAAHISIEQLKEMDDFLEEQGFIHLIYISPSVKQVVEGHEKDQHILRLINEHDLPVIYLLDEIIALELSNSEIQALFYDYIHLSQTGHSIWAKIISDDLTGLINE